MDFHANHALGLPQRLTLVEAIERGSTLRAAAAALSVALATAHVKRDLIVRHFQEPKSARLEVAAAQAEERSGDG